MSDSETRQGAPERPTALRVLPDELPEELRTGIQHTAWEYVLGGGKWTKPPLNPDGNSADVSDRSTWVTLDEALEAYRTGSLDGVGRFLRAEDGLVGILSSAVDAYVEGLRKRARAEADLKGGAGR